MSMKFMSLTPSYETLVKTWLWTPFPWKLVMLTPWHLTMNIVSMKTDYSYYDEVSMKSRCFEPSKKLVFGANFFPLVGVFWLFLRQIHMWLGIFKGWEILYIFVASAMDKISLERTWRLLKRWEIANSQLKCATLENSQVNWVCICLMSMHFYISRFLLQ